MVYKTVGFANEMTLTDKLQYEKQLVKLTCNMY